MARCVRLRKCGGVNGIAPPDVGAFQVAKIIGKWHW